MAGFIQRVDDAINPIVVKELRQAVKSRFVVAVLLIFLVLQLGWIALQLLVVGAQGRIDSLEFQAGREVFGWLQGILLATCLLFIPLYTALRLAAERNEANTDLLFITTIQPRSIISGKILSAIVLAILIFSACIPFMGLTYYLRGIDWPVILVILAIDFLVVIVSVQLMVFLAVIPGNMVTKAMLGLFGLGCLFAIFGMTMGSSTLLLYQGDIFGTERVEVWYTYGGVLAIVAALGGLFFTWSVAMVSSPSSNRALGVRLYMLGLTIVSGIVATAMCYGVGVEVPFIIWMWIAGGMAAGYMVIAINERREWSPRVSRQIPRSVVGRIAAFPFFSGAAGGIVFSLLLLGVIFVGFIGFSFWAEAGYTRRIRAMGPNDLSQIGFQATFLGALYTYCYCMTAVFIQWCFMPKLKTTLTWVVLLCIFAFGVLAPLILSLLFYLNEWHYERHLIWLVTNPFSAIAETGMAGNWRHGDQREIFWYFTGAWAALVTLVNIRWFGGQFARFRRTEVTPPPIAVLSGDASS